MPSMNSEVKQLRLKEWLTNKLPFAEELSINHLQRASGGFASLNHFFSLRYQEKGQWKRENLVIKQQPRNTPPDYNLAMQFNTIRCLYDSDVPVPKVYWLEEDSSVLGTPFFIMGKVEGEILDPQAPGQQPHGLLYEASPERRTPLWNRALEVIVKINTLDWKTLGLSFLGVSEQGINALDRQIDFYESHLRWAKVEPMSFFNRVFTWLRSNRYEPKYISLCWGDARPGNLMYRDDKVAAVLDWDMAHIGPPESDLAWFLTLDWLTSEECAGLRVPRWEGLPESKETITFYENMMGRNLDNFFYHEVFAMLRMCIIFAHVSRLIPEIPSQYDAPKAALRKLASMLGIEDDI